MKFRVFSLLCLISTIYFLSSQPVFARPPTYYVPDELVVQVQKNVELQTENGSVVTNNSRLQTVLDDIGTTACNEFFPFDRAGSRLSRMYLLKLTSGSDVFASVKALMATECVRYAQPNYEIGEDAVPSDESYSSQWGLATIQAASAWDLVTGNDQMIIGVVDSGVDYTHEDLANNMWINTDEIADNGIDDDGNGYIDDVYGWDFTEYTYAIPVDDSDNYTYYEKNEDADPGNDGGDPHGFKSHGTHVAGIVGAQANNTVTGEGNVVGVLWNCKIMAVQAGDGNGDLADTWIVKGVRYAVDNGARVVNMSFGGGTVPGFVDFAMKYAHSKGVVLCAASGNGDTSVASCPAELKNVISVAATQQDDAKASFSDYGSTVDIAAPGMAILSTVADNGYDNLSGTSMACPFISGAAGMILGYGETLGKTFSPTQVEYLLKTGADNIDSVNPDYVGELGAGRLNLYQSLVAAQNLPMMIRSIGIQTSAGQTSDLVVTEHSSCDFQAIATYSDGTTADVTSKVTWTAEPIRYGTFSDLVAGRFTTFDVPDDREIVIAAELVDEYGDYYTEQVVTIENDATASGLTIRGLDGIDPKASIAYRAIYQDDQGSSIDVTDQVTWAITQGAQYAAFDSAQPGLLTTNDSSAGQSLTITATYTDANSQTHTETKSSILVSEAAREATKLSIVSPTSLTAGTAAQLRALLTFADKDAPVDITALAKWSSSLESAGTFDDPTSSPGHFMPAAVSGDTTITITAQYTTNGKTYNVAQFQATAVPATALAVDVIEEEEDESIFSRILSWLTCNLLGMVLVGGLLFTGANFGFRVSGTPRPVK
jgi:subtilisin family serine protease